MANDSYRLESARAVLPIRESMEVPAGREAAFGGIN
jgi:hypothetical protein